MRRRQALLGSLSLLTGGLVACGHGAFPFPRPRYALARPGAALEWPCRIAPSGLVLVRGRVNGRGDVDFILDTGAPVSALVDGLGSAALGLDSSGAVKLGAADDPAAPVGVIRSGFEIAFAGLVLSDLTVVVVPQASMPCPERFAAVDFQGVIGADLMRRFVVEIDTAARVVRLFEPDAWHAPTAAVALPLSFQGGHPFAAADALIGAQRVSALRLHVDTGQSHDLNLVLGSRPEINAGLAREAREACFVNGRRTVWRAEALQLTLGSLQVPEVRTSLHDAAGAPRIGGRDGSLGIGVLGRYGLTIDYPGSRLLLRARA